MLLNDTPQRTRPKCNIVTPLGKPGTRSFGQFNRDIPIRKLDFKLQDELVDHHLDDIRLQVGKRDDRIQTVPEFRREGPLDRFFVLAGTHFAFETDWRFCHIRCTRVGGHHQHNITEINGLAVIIRQLAMVHDLQKDIEQVRMGFLDLVKQDNRMRMLINGIGQKATLIKPDITGRRTNQS